MTESMSDRAQGHAFAVLAAITIGTVVAAIAVAGSTGYYLIVKPLLAWYGAH